jgi:hypothetical protein
VSRKGNDRAMDPYRTLGVPRGCTREEVKEAFLARVPSAHPDRGGDHLAFIHLRAAYEQILADLDRLPRPELGTHWPAQATREDGIPMPVASTRKAYIAWLQRMSAEAVRRGPGRRRKWVRLLALTSRLLGITFLLDLIFFWPVAGLLSVASSILELEDYAHRAGWHSETMEGVFVAMVALVSLLSACWIVWKYDSG